MAKQESTDTRKLVLCFGESEPIVLYGKNADAFVQSMAKMAKEK